jgi:DNA recombination protein RmuC
VRRYEVLAENARVVSELGRELHSRLLTLVAHFDRLGASLTNAVQSYNRAVGSFDSRVLVSARRFAQLAGQEEEILTPRLVEHTARTVGAGDRPDPDSWAHGGDVPAPLAIHCETGASIQTREPAPARNG